MTTPDKNTLQSRLRERLEATGIKPAPLSKSIGASNSYVRDILRDRARMPSADKLKKLATALGTTVEYLLGETEDPSPKDALGPAVSLPSSGVPIFAGFVNAGLFRPVEEYFQQDGYTVPEEVRRVEKFSRVRQYAYQVQGHSMDLVGIDDGMWVVAADAADFIDTYGEVESGDLVVVQRTRFQGAERELTVKEIRYYRDRYELLPRSSDPNYKPIIVKHDHSQSGDDIEVQLVGVVLSAVRVYAVRRR